MRSEMDSISSNQVWTLVEPPEGIKPIGCKWVFKKKTDMDGNVQTYKGRLVAKGFRQIHGIDYDETFSPVAMFKSIRILLVVAAFHDYEIWKMDIKTAFLNGKLEEDVYMTQPEGFVAPENARKGEAAYILGVKIYRDRSRRILGLSQSTHIDKVLKRFSMEESKRGFLPMRHGISLSKEMCPSSPQERERMSQIPYALAIGSIMYAMICTRPDLSYALSMTSDIRQIQLSIKGYTDASFQTDMDDSRSQSGFVFCLNGGAVSWKSSKQDTIADSTTEVEYIAASEAAKEAVWIKKFVTELGVVPSISDAMELYCDNNGAIAQAKEPRSHQRSKHILRRFHLIREIIDRGNVEICKVHTDDNIVDPLTKPLTQQKHDRHTESLGIRYISPVNIQDSRFLRLNEERVFESEVVDWIEKLGASRSSRVREFVKKICSRFAAYQGTQKICSHKPLVAPDWIGFGMVLYGYGI
ncbi:hypothetical protein V6N13_042736 [Hibiscus sabdariffa]